MKTLKFQSFYQEETYLRRDREDPYSFFLEVRQDGEYKGQRWERFLICAYMTEEQTIDLFGPVDDFIKPGQRKKVRLEFTLIDDEDEVDNVQEEDGVSAD